MPVTPDTTRKTHLLLQSTEPFSARTKIQEPGLHNGRLFPRNDGICCLLRHNESFAAYRIRIKVSRQHEWPMFMVCLSIRHPRHMRTMMPQRRKMSAMTTNPRELPLVIIRLIMMMVTAQIYLLTSPNSRHSLLVTSYGQYSHQRTLAADPHESQILLPNKTKTTNRPSLSMGNATSGPTRITSTTALPLAPRQRRLLPW